MLHIKQIMKDNNIKQMELANYLNVGKASMNLLLNKNIYPKLRDKSEIEELITKFFQSKKITINFTHNEEEGTIQMLSLQAKKLYNLKRDPFIDEISSGDDVFKSTDNRFILDSMLQTSKNGGLLCVVGESGAGKTIIRKELTERINNQALPIKIIEPATIDKTRLTASSICEAILYEFNVKPLRSIESKCRQVQSVLLNASRNGQSHCLIIEEAHDLTLHTLKFLKRFWEMADGFKKLLGIILIAQPEIKPTLNINNNPQARELINRLEIVELEPINDVKSLTSYLVMKFKKLNITSPFNDEAVQEILNKLTIKKAVGNVNIAYPLQINNFCIRALNTGANLGASTIDGDLIKGI